VLDKHLKMLAEIQKIMPVISSLANRDLKPRHWQKIFEILGSTWQPGSVFTLDELIAMGVNQKIELVEEISGRASGEANIES